ncbi:MAG: hypothetical protein ABI478_07015, partial [Propionivibrio sp.]
ASLLVALAGFMLLLLGGVAHTFGWLTGRDAVPGFFAAFLLPLATGALTQLLPVWRHPGRRTQERDRMHAQMIRGGLLRSLLFLVGGAWLALGYAEGVWLVIAGLLMFLHAASLGLLLTRVSDDSKSP